MQRKGSIPLTFKKVITKVVFVAAAAGAMQAAHAGCGQYQKAVHPANNFDSSWASPRFIHTGFQQVDVETPSSNSAASPAPITGLWFFKYISEGNSAAGIQDGTVIDDGNTTWFADGNEATSSGMRAPATGSICLGTWKQTGENTYFLNHIGLSWDTVNNVFAGPAFIKQKVKLNSGGNRYAGTFDLKQFAADGVTLEVELKGNIVATRVTVDTDTQAP